MGKERLKYIDVAKGIGIFLVVWGHLLPDGFIDNLIYSFHMPLFLFLSGYMLRVRNVELTGVLVKKRIKQLLIPYLVFSAGYLIWEFFVNQESIVGMVYMTYQTITFRGMAPLWFLSSLFFAELCFLALMKWNKKIALAATVVLAGAHLLVGNHIDLSNMSGFVSNPLLFIIRTSLCVPFIACGYGVYALQKKWGAKTDRIGSLALACVLLLVCCGVVAVPGLDVNVHLYTVDNMGLFAVTSIAGSIGLLALSMTIGENRVLEELGKNSLMLMALHYPITQILKHYTQAGHWALATVTSFAAAVLLIAILCVIKKMTLKIFKKHSSKVKQ